MSEMLVVGQKVMLNSGSPELTVVEVEEGVVVVEWPCKSFPTNRASFPLACLTPIPNGSSENLIESVDLGVS